VNAEIWQGTVQTRKCGAREGSLKGFKNINLSIELVYILILYSNLFEFLTHEGVE